MYPEAGGSSSFARRAFNEFWSFVAAWAQMLTYIATIAISAFFVPHYLGGLFWEPLRHAPGDIIAGCAVIAVLAAINVFGAKESTGVNILLAVIDFATQLLLVLVGLFLVFSPEVAGRQRAPRRRADVEGLRPRDPDRHARLHGHRDDLEHVRGGAATRRRRSRPRSTACGSPCSRSTSRCRPSRCRRCRSRSNARRRVPDAAGPDRGAGRLRRRPDPRRRQADRPRAAAERRRDLRRPAGRDDPLPGHQRGHHRRLAARLLDGHPPPDARRAAPAAPAATARRGSASSSSPGFAILAILPGPGGVPGRIYSFGALLSFTMAHAAVRRLRIKLPDFPRPYRGPGNCTIARLRPAAVRDRRRDLHGGRVRRDRGRSTCGAPARRRLAGLRRCSSTSSSAAATGSTSPPRTRWRSRSRWSTTRRSTTRCSCRSATASTTSR